MTKMSRLVVFQQISLDGYFKDKHGDMTWAKNDGDEEFDAFSSENAKEGGVLLFGRVTYDMMSGFWPTPQAHKILPVVAERMNSLPKIVFSRTLRKASWNNTKVVNGDMIAEIRKMKKELGEGMAILGSGNVVSQLALADVIDEYQIVLNPIVLGGGRTMFDGIKERLNLKLTQSRIFRNGRISLSYKPVI
jgi:dihydrofolate reductase